VGARICQQGVTVDFYRGYILRIDLSVGSAAVEPLNMEWAERYVGGKGLLLRYLWEEVPPQVDPWAPGNPIILMTGPFAGTGVTTASRLVIGCKSPITGILNDSYVGGSFGPEMKFAGYDAIIISGQSPAPVVVTIKDDSVEFVPAAGKYWGMKTSDIEAALRADFDSDAKVLSIGPAGENQIGWACISTDQFHKAGRGGHGALMGRKNLKALAIRGTGAVSVGDARAFLADLYRLQTDYILTEDNLWAHEEGTPILAQIMSNAGVIPTRNWSAGTFEQIENINSDAFLKVRTKNRACYQCALGCRQFHEAGGVKGEGPEYETIALCGANCGIGDIEALMAFNALCDEWGLDTISSGSVTGLAMDLSEQGVRDFGLHFGDAAGYLSVPELLAKKEGIGAELALGARGLAAKYGRPELAMEVKNMELPGYDPRSAFGMSLAYATSDRGGCHMRTYPIAAEVISGALAPDTLEGKAERIISGNPAEGMIGQNFNATKFSLILCDFLRVLPELMCILFRMMGRETGEEEIFQIGERIWNLGRLFNLREGVEVDMIPAKLLDPEDAFPGGPSAGKSIGRGAFEQALAEFYSLRGWDERGVPTEAKLEELDVDVRL
jgi:aldehyde:ferredoxin oxidoreductase